MAKKRTSHEYARFFTRRVSRNRAAQAIALVTFSLALVTASLEIGLRLAAPQNLNGYWLLSGPDGLTINTPNRTARHQMGEVVVRYRFNRLGQRAEDSDLKACRRALVLGDSVTFGWLLKREQSFVGLLQARLDDRGDRCPWKLLNASVGGWGTVDQLLYLERFGPRIRPSAVIVFISYDDIGRSRRRGLYRFDKPTQSLVIHPTTPNSTGFRVLARRLPGYQWLLENSHLFQLIRNAAVKAWGIGRAPVDRPGTNENSRTGSENPRYGSEIFDQSSALALALFSRMADWCRRNQSDLIVLTNGWPTIRYGWIEDVMAEAGIAFTDLRPLVSPKVNADPDSYKIRGGFHPNAKAAALIAEAAWPFINQELKPD